ncbi:MAG TPA: hypothetical protein VK745_09965 [Polyangiaceae bacterium]|jgi:hypothetical protein|nr:hypothetical protein [Polyangiaceae bacterium]
MRAVGGRTSAGTARQHAPIATGIVLLALGLVGCNGQCATLGSCHSVDVDGGTQDDIIELTAGNAVSVQAASASMSSVHELVGGEVVVQPAAPACLPESGAPCRATLKRLTVRLDQLILTLSDQSTLTVDDATISVEAPLSIENAQGVYEIPAGTTFQTCALTNGRRQAASAVSSSSLSLELDQINHGLAIEGTLPMLLHADNEACSALALTVSGLIVGVSPWQQVAPQ